MENLFENKIIQVCSKCLKACCWHGEFMCEDAKTADVITFPVRRLRAMNNGKGNFESEDYWSDEKLKDVFGESAPDGYRVEPKSISGLK